MTNIILTIPGEPKGKQRPRWHKVGTYTPKETVDYETYIKELFVIKYPDFELLETALRLGLTAYLKIPKSKSQKKQALMESNDIKPTKKPDLDNVLKIFLDALEGLAYKNDNQFVRIDAFKCYSSKPRLEISIKEI